MGYLKANEMDKMYRFDSLKNNNIAKAKEYVFCISKDFEKFVIPFTDELKKTITVSIMSGMPRHCIYCQGYKVIGIYKGGWFKPLEQRYDKYYAECLVEFRRFFDFVVDKGYTIHTNINHTPTLREEGYDSDKLRDIINASKTPRDFERHNIYDLHFVKDNVCFRCFDFYRDEFSLMKIITREESTERFYGRPIFYWETMMV